LVLRRSVYAAHVRAKLGALVHCVVGLIAPGGVEGRVQGRGGGRSKLEVVLERKGGVGVIRGDGSGVRVSGILHGHGAPALAVVDVAVPKNCFDDGGWR